MSNTSEFITIIRPSFMKFCGNDACRAAAFNHLLFRIAGKSKDQPKAKIQAGDILWYAKTEQIREEMSKAWGVCKVRQEVNALLDAGLIGRRSNPSWGADRTKHFCFGTEQCVKFLDLCQEHNLCVIHLGLSPEVMHLIYSSNANDKSIKCICAIHQMEMMEVSDAFDKSIEAITIDSPTIDDTKEVRTLPALAATPTASPSGEDAHALSSPSCSLCSEQEDIHPCAQCGTRLCFEHRRDFPSEREPTRILCRGCLEQHNRAMVEQRSASADSASVTVLAPTAKAEPLIASATEPDKPKRTKKASSKPALPIEEVALRKEVQTWVDKERGYSLRGRAPKEQIFAEAAATETLAHMLYVRKVEGNVQEGCEWADLVYVRTYCAKQDKYWSKPENRARLGSYAVLQQFNVALALRQTEVPQNMTSLHVVGGRQETPLQRRNREMREKYENPVAKREAVTHGA